MSEKKPGTVSSTSRKTKGAMALLSMVTVVSPALAGWASTWNLAGERASRGSGPGR